MLNSHCAVAFADERMEQQYALLLSHKPAAVCCLADCPELMQKPRWEAMRPRASSPADLLLQYRRPEGLHHALQMVLMIAFAASPDHAGCAGDVYLQRAKHALTQRAGGESSSYLSSVEACPQLLFEHLYPYPSA